MKVSREEMEEMMDWMTKHSHAELWLKIHDLQQHLQILAGLYKEHLEDHIDETPSKR